MQPPAEAMFAAAAGAFSKLAGVAASAGPAVPESGDASIRIEPDTVATLTRVPATGVTFVSRFVKADVGRVVELMLGTPADETDGGEMDAMQLSIVAETVAQIATAMGERLATETENAGDGTNSEVVNDAGSFPVPPFIAFRAAISLGSLETSVTLDFDGIALGKIEIPAAAAPSPPPAAAAAPTVAPPPAAAPPATAGAARPPASRAGSEGQPVAFTAMAPTQIRTATPGQANLDLVHDVPLEISAVLGQTELSLREVVAMQPGSVFELDKLSTEPIDLYVNKILIARGEVVVVDDKFAVKISELNPVVDKL
jgi:flagellar motor switch protein FliN